MTIRKSKPDRRRERERDVSSRHHRHRSGHSHRSSIEYWRQSEFRDLSSRTSQRHSSSSGSSSSSKSGNIQEPYSYSDNYGWQRNSSPAGEAEDDVSQEINLWNDVPEQDNPSDQNNSDDEYRKSYHHYNREEDIEFARRLREGKGLEICLMAQDGACLFRAVAHQVFGDSSMHEEVRRLCIDYISLNRDYFSQFITEDFDRYVERKRKNDCFGNHVELQAISEMYNRPLEIYRYSTEPQLLTPQIEPGNLEMVTPIRLSYHQEGHYNSVIDPYKATVGVGLGLPGHQPGSADRHQMDSAKKESERLELEEAMLKDKLKETNFEAVQEQIEKQVAAESFLEWFNKNNGAKSKDPGVGPSRSSNINPLCKVKSPSASSSCPNSVPYKDHCSGRSPNSYSSQSSPHSPHTSHKPAKSKSRPCGPIPSSSGNKRRSSRNSPPTGSCSPSAYGATAASLLVSTSPKSSTSPVHNTSISDTWSDVHFNETASLMNGSIPVELKELDDFLLHQVLIESQREYWLQLTRGRSDYQSGNEQSSSVSAERSGEAGCSKN